MRRSFLFIFLLIVASAWTWAIKVTYPPPEKKYTVTLPLQGWIQVTNNIEITKQQLRKSDLPSRDVTYICDSLLTPLQSTIGQQVNAQIASEQGANTKPIKPDSTTKPKKN